jgi:hypothetical protein
MSDHQGALSRRAFEQQRDAGVGKSPAMRGSRMAGVKFTAILSR